MQNNIRLIFFFLFALSISAFSQTVVTPVGSPSVSNNDFTVIQDAVTAASSGDIIDLQGTFDWTETNAYNSYVASSIGSISGDIRGIRLPNVNNLKITSSTANAEIISPGDINDGALIFSSCFYHPGDVSISGLTVEKIHFNNFEGCVTLEWDSYSPADGTTIQNNVFTIAGDNGDATDWIQNIAVYLGGGTNQSVINNMFKFKANGTRTVGYSGAATGASYGYQSATNPNGYNGLTISDNTFQVEAGSDPANMTYGIWENSHSDDNAQVINLNNNTFLGRVGDDFDYAFKLSSLTNQLSIDNNTFSDVDNIYVANHSW